MTDDHVPSNVTAFYFFGYDGKFVTEEEYEALKKKSIEDAERYRLWEEEHAYDYWPP